MSDTAASELEKVIHEGVDEERLVAPSNPHWTRMNELGTELWLDTGDMDEAARLWSNEFTALTTNNTLLNKEIQKGIYDDWIPRAAEAARSDGATDETDLVLEIAFALNARHGLRLVKKFGADVSVELHTNLAHDVERSVAYGRRYAKISPEHFIVKVPLTAEGLVAARHLVEDGIRVNFTLGFSARENVLIACVAQPHYCNVFMGRLNAYASDEGLGDGSWVGEKATLASQAAVARLRADLGIRTRQIGASMRMGEQVATLAGHDIYTMPLAVAEAFLADPPAVESLSSRVHETYEPTWNEGIDPALEGLETLWAVPESFEKCCREMAGWSLAKLTPESVSEHLHTNGHGSVLPRLHADLIQMLRESGKMPKREQWRSALASGEVGLDALFTLAGLHSFAQDQAALDERILKQLG